MKRIVCLLLSLLLLCACVPTPEVDAVKQKNTNRLIEMAIESDAHETGAVEPVAAPLASTLPERFQCDFWVASDGLHVTADVPIRVLTERSSFPMLRVERRTLTDEQRIRLLENLFGKEPLYVYEYRMTREQLAAEIKSLMQEPTEEDKRRWMREMDGTEQEWEQTQQNRTAELKRLQEQYNALPDDDSPVPLSVWDGSLPWANSAGIDMDNYMLILVGNAADSTEQWRVDHARFFDARVTDVVVDFETGSDDFSSMHHASIFDRPDKPGVQRIMPEDYNQPHDGASISAAEAALIATEAFSGIADFSVNDIYWSNNAMTDGDTRGVIGQWAYLVRLTPNFDGASMPYVEGFVYNRQAQDDAAYRTWQYDGAIVAVDGNGKLLSARWAGALSVTKTISESTTLLPFEQIQTLFQTQMQRKFAELTDGELILDDVQLGLFRIREQNSMQTGLLVPAWFFTGTVYHAGEGTKSQHYNALNPLCILNAMDGSVIDADLGY